MNKKDRGDSKTKTKRDKKTLGPVDNLEPYVREDWWKYLFNRYYLKTDGDVINDSGITRTEVDLFLKILNPNLEDRILDLCCGQGRHSIELARRGYVNVEGLDRSHYLIRRAKQQAKKENLDIKFREGDARRLPYSPDEFSLLMVLGNSFGYFETRENDLRVLKEAYRVLMHGGKLLVDVADGEYLRNHFKARSWEWIDKMHFVCRERELSQDERIISREIIVQTDKGVIVDQFYAERLYIAESLLELLAKAGFKNPVFHDDFSPDSKRNQDLGMMERRLIITAENPKLPTPKKIIKTKEVKNVAVVFGDPDKPDTLKPNHVFDEDDLDTINRLKSALSSLRGYNFTYLNKHDNLFEDLKRLRGSIDFVLNLCDEGFRNDARQELHIPSMLEILGIAYTGANPQCLAHCYDKSLVRGIAREMGIPVAEGFLIKPDDMSIEIPDGKFPVIVKPNFGDSSFGITQDCVVSDMEHLLDAISKIRAKFGYDKPLLIEEFLEGKDLTLGIMGSIFQREHKILPITEEDYSELPEGLPRICGYEAKWLPASPYYAGIKTRPAELSEELKNIIINHSLALFERLECRDYARFDWRLNSEGNPRLLEVNPNPGWCWDGHLAKASAFAGMNYSHMFELILRVAEQRFIERNGKDSF